MSNGLNRWQQIIYILRIDQIVVIAVKTLDKVNLQNKSPTRQTIMCRAHGH